MRESQTNAPLIDFQIEDIWPILQKQRQVIFLFFVTVVLTTLVGGLLRTKEYRATALLHLSPRAGQEVTVNEVVDLNTRGYFEIQQFYRTQIQIFLSRKVREEVIRRYTALGYDDMPLEDGGADTLLGRMAVVPAEQSQLIDIHVTHTDPEAAAILANLVAEVYSDNNLAVRREAASHATEWLSTQLLQFDVKVGGAKNALFEFKHATNMADVEERMNTLSARAASLNAAFGDKNTKRVLLQTTVEAHEALLKKSAWERLAKVLGTPLLEATARDYAVAQRNDADLATRYGDKHPKRLQSQANLRSIRQTMVDEIRRNIAGERAQLDVLKQEETNLGIEIQTVKDELLEFQRKESEYDALHNELERSQSFYEKLSSRLEEVSLSSQTQLNNVQIVDRAMAPTVPHKPNIPMSLVVSVIVGAFGGIGLALIREYLDDTITSQIDVNTHLKVPFLGLIPRLPEGVVAREADLYTHFNPRSAVSESVRGLRAMLEMNPNGPPPRRILVTSSVAREGKTSTTMRLAVSFAQMGRKTVVIDADLRRPRVHKVFAADNRVGLSSYLVGAAKAEDLPTPTLIPNLQAIYSGSATDHPVELMASAKMEELLTELEQHFDVILIDTPPSVALSDAVTLSRRVDGILLVVKEQSVSRAVVKQTIDLLKQVDANILGVVLNHVDLRRGGSKYKYYHAYRDYYSTYAPENPTPDAKESSGAAAK